MRLAKTILAIFLIFILIDTLIVNSYIIKNEMENNSIIVGPYPQNPGKNSITICWETSEKTRYNKVSYGQTIECEKEVFENNLLKKAFHTVTLTDLLQSTVYFYKVESDGVESNMYSFYTSCQSNDTIKFIVYGDNRGEWDNWRNASIIAKAIERENPHFVINTGDLVENGTIQNQWYNFFETSDFIHNSTLFPILGNHEKYGSYYFNYFILPNNEKWYSVNAGPVKLICLDSNSKSIIRPIQILWLIKELKSNNNPFTIVSFHHPLYSSGNHGSHVGLRFLWGTFLHRYKVDLVINGHDHSYERGKVFKVNYIVTGGGGGPLYDVESSWWTVYSEKTYHYCLIEANNQYLTFKAIKPNGTIFDSFQIEK